MSVFLGIPFVLENTLCLDCPGSTMEKNPSANAGDAEDTGMIPGLGRIPGGENGNPPQYSCLENSMDREVWWVGYNPGGHKELDMTE